MSASESLPIGTVTPEQVQRAKAAAAAQELAAIVERHARDEAYAPSVAAELHADRGWLLDILRRVAAKAWSGPCMDRHGETRVAGFGFVRPRYRSDDRFHDECIFCEAEPDAGERHTVDCPAPLLEVLRPTDV